MGYLSSSCIAESSISTCVSSKQQVLHSNFQIKHFSYSLLHSSTNGFSSSNFLGKGSHGSVYKASLNDGKLIAAVKLTSLSASTAADNEIEILSRVRSPRIVNLLGFAVDSANRKLIVVQFMPNGTLNDLLHSVAAAKPPSCTRRLRFALQIAKAVQHLHSSSPPVIHRDIKSSNVLIDANRNARLGDFGLALRGHVEDVRVKCTPPAGTLGYLDPGYLAPGDLSTKSDVFSFGILLLEIISGRNAIDMNYSPPSVVEWAVPMIKSGDYLGICDPRIETPANAAVIEQLVIIAARCVRSKAEKRPDMSEVVECLRTATKEAASPIWSSFGRRVVRSRRRVVRSRRRVAVYEALEEKNEMVKASRGGIRRNRKVSSVASLELEKELINSDSDRVVRGKSKSIGSINEIEFGPLDGNMVKKKLGLAVKMPMVKLRKSRSTSVLQGKYLVENKDEVELIQITKNPNSRELEESKLLIDKLGKVLKN